MTSQWLKYSGMETACDLISDQLLKVSSSSKPKRLIDTQIMSSYFWITSYFYFDISWTGKSWKRLQRLENPGNLLKSSNKLVRIYVTRNVCRP